MKMSLCSLVRGRMLTINQAMVLNITGIYTVRDLWVKKEQGA
jgi:hypothetical protein